MNNILGSGQYAGHHPSSFRKAEIYSVTAGGSVHFVYLEVTIFAYCVLMGQLHSTNLLLAGSHSMNYFGVSWLELWNLPHTNHPKVAASLSATIGREISSIGMRPDEKLALR